MIHINTKFVLQIHQCLCRVTSCCLSWYPKYFYELQVFQVIIRALFTKEIRLKKDIVPGIRHTQDTSHNKLKYFSHIKHSRITWKLKVYSTELYVLIYQNYLRTNYKRHLSSASQRQGDFLRHFDSEEHAPYAWKCSHGQVNSTTSEFKARSRKFVNLYRFVAYTFWRLRIFTCLSLRP